jgi:hypothetical protein
MKTTVYKCSQVAVEYADAQGQMRHVCFVSPNKHTYATVNVAELNGSGDEVHVCVHTTSQWPAIDEAMATNTNLAKLCADPQRLAEMLVRLRTEDDWDEGLDGEMRCCGTVDYYVTTDGAWFFDSYEDAVAHQLRWLLSAQEQIPE